MFYFFFCKIPKEMMEMFWFCLLNVLQDLEGRKVLIRILRMNDICRERARTLVSDVLDYYN